MLNVRFFQEYKDNFFVNFLSFWIIGLLCWCKVFYERQVNLRNSYKNFFVFCTRNFRLFLSSFMHTQVIYNHNNEVCRDKYFRNEFTNNDLVFVHLSHKMDRYKVINEVNFSCSKQIFNSDHSLPSDSYHRNTFICHFFNYKSAYDDLHLFYNYN